MRPRKYSFVGLYFTGIWDTGGKGLVFCGDELYQTRVV